ncbi:hypothetical protein Tsubulata_032139 [Turnera subulata]|uniref:DNA-directed primase/polymerase protein n=1 Tax=Turnera subulata TaxID=218843 RepID=A0A9Q0F2B8_9ROSI|nr:hypothetical protein Tsubulata_032139 [Turnera subulata]
MDDVDRLFECFKCGISPPQSALRERKRSRSKLKQVSSATEPFAACSTTPSPGSAQQPKKKNSSDAQLSLEKLGSTGAKENRISRSGKKQISPVVFYGSPHGVPPKRPISLLRLLREIRVDLAEQPKLKSREEVWATFPRQNEAMNFAKEHANVSVFSYQDHYNGQRRFLVSTYKEFWRRYKNMDPKFRHHYEVIQEGFPCHLYFDLEFNNRDNIGKNGDEMVDFLISLILEALHEKYSIQGNQDWVVELDSSTAEKFSRHLIIRIPQVAFKDNSHVGAFVSEICSRILAARGKDGRFDSLFVRKDSSAAESTSQLFIDAAVYSRNRCFRLALSSKAGKSSVLLPTGRFSCKDLSEENMYMASLICNVDADCKKFLVCKMDVDCVKKLHFDTEVNSDYRQCSTRRGSGLGDLNDASKAYITGKSPFPALDDFIESIASIGTVSGKIRSWYWFSEYALMVYSMSRNRYCERIGRQHKSNHVMYVVDLRWAVYYQKCHDPDCQGYRSPIRPIPMDRIPNPSFSHNSEQMVEQMELTDANLGTVVNYDFEGLRLYNDEDAADGSGKDSWWLEAVKVADDIESKRETVGPGNESIWEEDAITKNDHIAD